MKRSLHIGINDYPGTNQDLSGCVNDAAHWKAALAKRGFEWQDVLLDAQAHHKAMTDAIADIVEATKAGDVAVITYSGHGTWVPDTGDDEPDGRDEALCPHDGKPLLDDYLHEVFSAAHDGAKIIMLSDSCHSGSVNRLATNEEESPFTVKLSPAPKVKYLAPELHLTDAGWGRVYAAEKRPLRAESKGFSGALLISGCADHEYSYDAWFDGKPQGAFSYVALWTLERLKPDASYMDWYAAIKKYLPHVEYPQTPQLAGSTDQYAWRVFE